MNTRDLWLLIARLRKAEGDIAGAERAKTNANAYRGRYYKGDVTYWRKGVTS